MIDATIIGLISIRHALIKTVLISMSSSMLNSWKFLALLTIPCVNCLQPFPNCAERINAINPKTIVVLHFYQFSQELLEFCFSNLIRVRDYFQHVDDPLFMAYAYEYDVIKYAPMLSIVKLGTDYLNVSIISDSCALQANLGASNLTNIYPHVSETDGSEYSLPSVWSQFLKEESSQVGLQRVPSGVLNFAYCSEPQFQQIRICDLEKM